MSFLSFDHWPLRAKTLVMLLLASTMPVAITAWITYRAAREIIEQDMANLLGTRADQLVSELEGFHVAYSSMTTRFARMKLAVEACEQGVSVNMNDALRGVIESDSNIVGMSVTDKDGNFFYSSDGNDATRVPAQTVLLRAAFPRTTVTNVYTMPSVAGQLPLISYTAPVHSTGRTCLAAIHVRANAFWDAVRATNGRTGEGSYTVVANDAGIRIAHSFRQNQVFRPTGPVDPEMAKVIIDSQRYGPDTEQYLSTFAPVPEEYRRSTAKTLAGLDEMYRYVALESGDYNLGVARRLSSIGWTVFAVVPEEAVLGSLGEFVQKSLVASGVIIVGALLLGWMFAERIARPLRKVAAAADQLARGDLTPRVQVDTQDEFGVLGTTFNRMADAIASIHEELENRVRDRTVSLERANDELHAQKEELLAQRTELQAQQRELQLKNTEVERAGQLKTDFLANMSHELRTPLNSIIGFSELLVDQAKDRLQEREVRYLNDVLNSGRHLLSLINDILDLSKIEAGHSTLDIVDVSPSASIEEARELVHATAMARRIEIQTKIADDGPVRADVGKLRQILLNLMSNALKFSPEGSTVVVGTERVDGMVRFSVRDAGPGIDEALRSRLFQPFVQGENPLIKTIQGTGLGLAICKRLVEQHGGTIDVVSSKGDGATFRFTMPAAEPGTTVTAPNADKPLVLVMDDDRNSAAQLKTFIESNGYRVQQVDAGNDTAEMVSRLKPAALVLNPATDSRDGLRILDELTRRESTRDTPVIVTAAPRANDFVPKPIETQRFLTEIKQMAPVRQSEQRPRVLAIDDDPHVGALLTGLLEPAGYQVIACQRGKQGLSIAQQQGPTVVVVDLLMPEMSGFEVIDALEADPLTRGIPIIVLTAADTSEADRVRMKQHVRAVAQKGSISRQELLAAIDRAAGKTLAQPPPTAKTILVVDDHDLNRELARSILEHMGYHVLLANDGDAGIQMAIKHKPALVLMDLAMPKKDGFQAARELKKNKLTERIPIVALTAMAMRGDEVKAFEAGMDDYLTKPIDRKALESVLMRFLG